MTSVHYAIMPVIQDKEDDVKYETLLYKGYDILACQTEKGYILERLFSTDPGDFLIPDLQPGNVLENSLIKKNNQ